jgi:hypothetical protein
MNIYLDIDGVLLINETNASPYANEFIQAVLKESPETTYWLTTHCWRGENITDRTLGPTLKESSRKLLSKIKPTEWGEYKTDAIDLSEPFLWFDDDLFDHEKRELIKHHKLSSYVPVDLQSNPNQLRDCIEIIAGK